MMLRVTEGRLAGFQLHLSHKEARLERPIRPDSALSDR